jgi:broad specificity phosphatase PhoE
LTFPNLPLPSRPPAGHQHEWPAAVYLLRHAETEWSASGRHTSRTDVPLTEDGERRAKRAGELLRRLRGADAKPPVVLSSPRRRALRTAELAGLRTPIVLDELAEWDYGEYEGLTTPQIRQTVPGWTVWTHPSPGGETAEQVTARADRVLARVRELCFMSDIVLIGHGHFSRVLAARWIGLPATSGVHFALDAGAITALGHERGVPRLDHVNLADSL